MVREPTAASIPVLSRVHRIRSNHSFREPNHVRGSAILLRATDGGDYHTSSMDFTPEQCRAVLDLARATIRSTLGSAACTGSVPAADLAPPDPAARTIAIAIAPAPPTPPAFDPAL